MTLPQPGQAPDDPDHRLRPPRRRAVQGRQHRHDAARPPQRGVVDDQHDVDSARPARCRSPGYGTAKINSAYEDGGPGLLIKTIRANVFPDLKVNHLVDVNFSGFAKLVNAIGCVYSDVDHRYYNNTIYTDYSSIDIQPGYQKLCGVQALQFVRFRHTDSDLVRNARQQDFVRWAKDQYGVSRLFSNRIKLLEHLRQARPDRPQPAYLRRPDRAVRPRPRRGRLDDPAVQVPRDPARPDRRRRAELRHRGPRRGAAGLRQVHDAHAQAQGQEDELGSRRRSRTRSSTRSPPPGSPRTCPMGTARPRSWPS